MIGAKFGLSQVAKVLGNQLKREVTAYKMLYSYKDSKFEFQIDTKSYPYKNEILVSGIEAYISDFKKKIQDKYSSIDGFIIIYDNGSIEAGLFCTTFENKNIKVNIDI